jgi:hypothetical protein
MWRCMGDAWGDAGEMHGEMQRRCMGRCSGDAWGDAVDVCYCASVASVASVE